MKRHRGFTLIEMLCVLAISGIVMVAVSNMVGNTLIWSHWGNEEAIIGTQMEQALDYMENDIRKAKGIDVAYWTAKGDPATMYSNGELRLRTTDPREIGREGTVAYFVKAGTQELMEDTPTERPIPNHFLYRNQEDKEHKGKNQSIAMHLNSPLDAERGLRVYYYKRGGVPCSLVEEVASVRVVLSGWTEAHVLVSRSRTIPFNIKDD